MDKPLARMIKGEKMEKQIIKSERDVTKDFTDIKITIRKYK